MKKLIVVTILVMMLLSIFQAGNALTTDTQIIKAQETTQQDMLKAIEIKIYDNVKSDEWVNSEEHINYTIHYKNPNDQPVENVLIKATLSDWLIFKDGSAGYNHQNNWVKWIRDIPRNNESNITMLVEVKPDLEKIRDATVNVSTTSISTIKNFDLITTLIGTPKPLQIHKKIKNNENIDGFLYKKSENNTINYNITVKNPNPVNLTYIWINDQLPQELDLQNFSKENFVDNDEGVISWYQDSIVSNETIKFFINTSINSTVEAETWIINKAIADSSETAKNETASKPLLYSSNKKVYYSQYMFQGWNKFILKEETVENNDFSIDYIFASILDKTSIIYENSTGKNYIPTETGNTLHKIQEEETYLIKINEDALLYIYEKENQKPSANAGGTYQINKGETLTLDASQSNDPDGTINSYRWDFKNNGTWTSWYNTPSTQYTYYENKTHTVKLQVQDDKGMKDTDTTQVTVINLKPQAKIDIPEYAVTEEEIIFDVSESSDDGHITSYRWDFDNDGTYDTEWLNNSMTKHTYTTQGEYEIKLQIKDDDNLCNETQKTILIKTPNNPPSKPTVTGEETGYVDETYTYTITTSDEDGDKISIYVDWGDGTKDEKNQINSGEEVTFTHSWSSYGSNHVSVYAVDEKNARSETLSKKIMIYPGQDTFDGKENTTEESKKEEQEGGFPFIYIIFIILVITCISIALLFLQKKEILRIDNIFNKFSTSHKQDWDDNYEQEINTEPGDTWD